MVPVRAHAGQRVCVLRLTEAGFGAAQALASGGASVTVWDEDEARCDAASALGLKVEDPSTRDWSDLAALVVGDKAMLDEDVSIRAVDMAHALDIPVIDATSLIARALVSEYDTTVCVVAGTQADAVARIGSALLDAIGADVVGPDLSAAPRRPGPGSVVLLTLEDADVAITPDLLVVTSGEAQVECQRIIAEMTGPVVLNADDPAAARLATRAPLRSILASGRQSLGGGVFVCAGAVFDGIDGPPSRLTPVPAGQGVAVTPPGLLAMAHGLVRACEYSLDRSCEALEVFEGVAGWGKAVARFGPVQLLDYSDTKDLRSVLLALRAPGPVIWVAGPALEKGSAALIEAAGRTPTRIFMTGDRAKAAKGLSRLCPTQIVTDTGTLTARALFAALKAGPDARIVIAPGCEGGPKPSDLADALDTLIQQVRQGEAA
ncbi:hypothetical protein NHF40_11710 [Maricaulaceae bacterium EIL42A08]|nr:hypothetical protein [Maricaulaceae bacterium EIL42A08]